MAKKKVKRVSRGRKLTKREAVKYKQVREKAEAEKPDVQSRVAARMQTAETIRRLGERLRQIREEQGKSLADIRELTGMDRSAIAKLETGQRENPSLDTLIRYAQALGKSVAVSLEDGKPNGKD